MGKTICATLLLSCLAIPSCGTMVSDISDVAAYAVKLKDRMAGLEGRVDAKLGELSAAQAEQLSKIEAVSGPLDKDGDGAISADEVKAAVGGLVSSGEGRDLLLDWETYAALLAALAGVGAAKKGSKALAKQVVKHGNGVS